MSSARAIEPRKPTGATARTGSALLRARLCRWGLRSNVRLRQHAWGHVRVASERVVLTENAGDFVRIAAEHSTAGGQHAGVLTALSSRFSRRPAGIQPLIAASRAVESHLLAGRVVYLALVGQET
jgi:hypothetical protein